jgi:hypothetical protein
MPILTAGQTLRSDRSDSPVESNNIAPYSSELTVLVLPTAASNVSTSAASKSVSKYASD